MTKANNGRQPIASNDGVVALKAALSRLKAELKRTIEKRYIPKNPTCTLPMSHRKKSVKRKIYATR